MHPQLTHVMKTQQQRAFSSEILYKTEVLLNAASNRYRVTIQVANKAKRKKYSATDNTKLKPIIRAILEITDELKQVLN